MTYNSTLMCLSCTVFELERVICSKSLILTYHTCNFVTPWVYSVQIRRVFDVRKLLESLGHSCAVVLPDTKFSGFDTTPA